MESHPSLTEEHRPALGRYQDGRERQEAVRTGESGRLRQRSRKIFGRGIVHLHFLVTEGGVDESGVFRLPPTDVPCRSECMFRFSRALFSDKLVSQQTRERMFQPFKQSHGLGCIVEDYNGWKVVHHPGGTQGVRTSFKTFLKPGGKVVVIDLFNTDFMLSHIADTRIEKIALGEAAEPVFHSNPSWANSFRAFAGTYEISADDKFQILIEGDRIYYQETGREKRLAFPFSETAIYVKEINSRFHFTAGKTSGDVTCVGFYSTPAGALMVEGKRIQTAVRALL